MEIQELTAKRCLLLVGVGEVPGQYMTWERTPRFKRLWSLKENQNTWAVVELPKDFLLYLKQKIF